MNQHETDTENLPNAAEDLSSGQSVARWAVWFATIAAFAGFLTLVRVPTHLGVEAVAWDKSGREYVWRIWWRARDDVLHSGPSWAFATFYILLLIAFAGLCTLAMWLALVPDERISAESSSPPELRHPS